MNEHQSPPKFPLRFLRWFCREDYLDEIEGNIVEIFEKESLANPSTARRHLSINIIKHFRPEYIKLFHSEHTGTSTSAAMIYNYIKLAFRNLRKRPAFSLINISGLALGIAACLLILNYIDFETSYDDFHENPDRLFRVNRIFIQNGEKLQANVVTSYGLGPRLATEIPAVKDFVRTHNGYGIVTWEQSKGVTSSFREEHALFADSTFFRVFTFKPLLGDLNKALRNPYSVVLTEKTWHKIFGDEDPIGRTLRFFSGYPNEQFIVSAVVEDVPPNSHLNFDFVVPIHTILASDQYKNEDGWHWNNFNTYVELDDANNYYAVEGQLPDFCKRWMDPKWKSSNGRVELQLQPIRNIHTEPGLRNDGETIARSTIYFFGIIAIFILFIAWINYVNLSTARAIERHKEVGIKKAIGALRNELITQFLIESMVVNILAIILAVGIFIVLQPFLNEMIGKHLPLHLNDIRFWALLASLLLIGSITSGIYPAFVLSSFKISNAIKKAGDRGFSLRKSLVVFQFVSSLVLIAGTFAVYQQITYMQSHDKGLLMDQMLILNAASTMSWEDTQKKVRILKEEVQKIAGVEAVTTSGAIPGGGHNWGVDIRKFGEPETSNTSASIVYVDTDFIPTYDIEIIAGHNFDPHSASDMKSAIINEAALKALKFASVDEALTGRLLIDDTINIIGVAKNFNWSSLKADFTPFVLMPVDVFPYKVSVHLHGGSIPASIDTIEKIYRNLLPDNPFDYQFLDESFNRHYKADQQFGKIFAMFASLAVIICCLGLWGLASFATSQKLKEIGIRKVLGATATSLVMLLTRQFVILIAISAAIAAPLAWFGIDSWLNGFAFKVGIGWEMFAVPILTLAIIALLTISLQVRRGVVMNPADVLKAE